MFKWLKWFDWSDYKFLDYCMLAVGILLVIIIWIAIGYAIYKGV
jgi:hypothetical protein